VSALWYVCDYFVYLLVESCSFAIRISLTYCFVECVLWYRWIFYIMIMLVICARYGTSSVMLNMQYGIGCVLLLNIVYYHSILCYGIGCVLSLNIVIGCVLSLNIVIGCVLSLNIVIAV
jgi:hypothetical protein